MLDEVLEAWRINHRITLRVLEETSDEGLACTLSTRGGRDVAGQFGHIQTVRVYQLEKRGKPVSAGARKFSAKESPTRAELAAALEDTAARVEEWLGRAAAGEKGFRTMRPGVVPTLGYLISHEAHHRGNIMLTLKQCGHALHKDARYTIWDWSNM